MGVSEWNAWRSSSPDVKPDLSGIMLQGIFLQGINFSDACLQEASLRFCLFTDGDFTRADLRKAILRNSHAVNACFDEATLTHIGPQINFAGSSFRKAHFRECDLLEANFFGSDLSEAELISTNLTRVNFRRARMRRIQLEHCGLQEAFLVDSDLEEARMDRCTFNQTVMAGIDLSALASLEDSRHRGPSHVAGSLESSAIGLRKRPYKQGSVEAFLRGAGVSDEYLVTFRETIQRPIEFYSCFISYSHSDSEFARRLYSDLQMAGIRCWLDEHALLPGDDIYAEVDEGIRLWEKVLLCCSREALSSWWVERELDTAFEKERILSSQSGDSRLVVIPLDLDGHLWSWNGSHAAALRKRVAARFLGWQSDGLVYRQQLERLQRALRSDPGGRTRSSREA